MSETVSTHPGQTIAGIVLTERAAKQISKILKAEPEGTRLRISVAGGGCSGFQYGFTLDDTRNEDDVIIQRDGVEVLIDEMSTEYMAGSEIDYVDDLIGQSFQIKNPLAQSSCGCGTSFSL